MRRVTMILTFFLGIFIVLLGYGMQKFSDDPSMQAMSDDFLSLAIVFQLAGIATIASAFAVLNAPKYTAIWLIFVFVGTFVTSKYGDTSWTYLSIAAGICLYLSILSTRYPRPSRLEAYRPSNQADKATVRSEPERSEPGF